MTNYQEIVDIIARRRAFLDDTINYYNSKNRSMISKPDGFERCLYLPAHDNTAGCAIGRHLPIELAKQLDLNELESSISNRKNFELIPTWMQEMGKDFLSFVQELHDGPAYWNENGISETGNEFVLLNKDKYIN